MDHTIEAFPDREEEDSQGRQPLVSGVVVHNGTAYVSGKGARGERDIRKATEICLDSIEQDLERVGSSMNSDLKLAVFLDVLNEFSGINGSLSVRYSYITTVRSI